MNDIFKEFRNRFYDYLKSCDHPFSDESVYHMEGDIWTHTMLVFNQARLATDSKIMKITALLHDLGKPLAKFNKDGKVRFSGHENISVLLSIGFLLDLFKINYISKSDLLNILYLINYHGILWQKSEKQIKEYFDKHLFSLIKEFSTYDTNGNLFLEKTETNNIEIEKDNFIEYDENKPNCVIMVGIPNSGKSSYNLQNNYKVLSRDDILVEYGMDKYKMKKYSDIWAKLSDDDQKEIDRILQKKFRTHIQNQENFVIDMTNMNIKSRKKWIHNLKNKYNIFAKVFLTDFNIIKKRNNQRFEEEGKLIPETVLINMAKRLELPLFKEGFCKIDIILNNKFEFEKEKNI
jgi:predicted kinase